MAKSTPDHGEDAITRQPPVAADQHALPIILRAEYTSAEEAIGALSRELIISGKSLTFKEINLLLIVRLKLASAQAQQDILREALMLITNRTPSNAFH